MRSPRLAAGVPIAAALALSGCGGGASDRAFVIDSGRRLDTARAIRGWLEAEVTGIGGHITVRSEQPNTAPS